VEQLREVIREMSQKATEQQHLIEGLHKERVALARLAAKGPAFSNPIEAWEAEALRDLILASIGLNPDGTTRKDDSEKSRDSTATV